MGIKARCPACGKSYVVKRELAGKKVRCQACRTSFLVPSGVNPDIDDVAGRSSEGQNVVAPSSRPTTPRNLPLSDAPYDDTTGPAGPLTPEIGSRASLDASDDDSYYPVQSQTSDDRVDAGSDDSENAPWGNDVPGEWSTSDFDDEEFSAQERPPAIPAAKSRARQRKRKRGGGKPEASARPSTRPSRTELVKSQLLTLLVISVLMCLAVTKPPRKFGDFPLGLPLWLFMMLVVGLFSLPVPFWAWHLYRIVTFRLKTVGGYMSRTGVLIFAYFTCGFSYPELRNSQAVMVASAFYLAWIIWLFS